MLYYVIALLIIATDQLTKWLVVKNMELGQSIPIIDQVFYITSHRNTGALHGDISRSDVVFLPHYNRGYYWHCLLHTALYKRTKASWRGPRTYAWRCHRQLHRPGCQTGSCGFYPCHYCGL